MKILEYSKMIDTIMPLVDEGSERPFIISRVKGEWEIDYLSVPKKWEDEALTIAKERDPFAVLFTGEDFSHGSYPYVFDKVIKQRLYAEEEALCKKHSENDFAELDNEKLDAFVGDILDDNMGDFSDEVMDFFTTCETPLETLYNAVFRDVDIDLSEDSDDLDEHGFIGTVITENLIQSIERYVEGLRTKKHEIDYETSNRRVIEGYEEKTGIHIGGCTVILAENLSSDEPYLVAEIKRDNPLGVEEITFHQTYDDYVDAVFWFDNSIMNFVESIQAERKERRKNDGVERVTLKGEHCVPKGLDEDIKDKVIIINPDVLSPDYRSSDYQLKIAVGGFGCKPNSRGSAVFCKDLYSGEESRFERYDILGTADLTKLPEWAKKRLSPEKPTQAAEQTDKAEPNKFVLVSHGSFDEHILGKFPTKAAAKQYADECDVKNYSIKAIASAKNKKPSALARLEEGKKKAAEHPPKPRNNGKNRTDPEVT